MYNTKTNEYTKNSAIFQNNSFVRFDFRHERQRCILRTAQSLNTAIHLQQFRATETVSSGRDCWFTAFFSGGGGYRVFVWVFFLLTLTLPLPPPPPYQCASRCFRRFETRPNALRAKMERTRRILYLVSSGTAYPRPGYTHTRYTRAH